VFFNREKKTTHAYRVGEFLEQFDGNDVLPAN